VLWIKGGVLSQLLSQVELLGFVKTFTGSIHCLDNPQSSQMQLKEVTERDEREEEIFIAKEEMNRLKRIINIQSRPPLI
jgi:hypothetical protein